MNDPKETQQELFEEFSATPKRQERFPLVSRTQKPILFSTNTEQMLMGGILFILALCGVFFLGVMRGKALSGRPLAEPPQAITAPRVSATPPAKGGSASGGKSQPAAGVTSTVKTQAPAIQAEILSKPYTLGLVTHRKKELAEAEMNALRAQGFYSFIKVDRDYYQVCVGQYASKDEAKKDLAFFSAKYKDCYLRRR